ncbi:MAG: hypothetical protein IPP37_14460 [Saprospiraceae bacterium]|nr:hypothetical protein [Saprospiraceae bacterium]
MLKKFTNTQLSFLFLFLSIIYFTSSCNELTSRDTKAILEKADTTEVTAPEVEKLPILDTVDYNNRMQGLANGDTTGKWPVLAALPLPGAILPFNRIVAFYGNLFSTRMGILGELPKEEMLAKLQQEVANWQAADSTTKTIPALHYIAVTAQSQPGSGNMYRLRMPFHQIDTIIAWAKSINALVFLDIQVGHSSVAEEVAMLAPYLQLPNVHLGIDPEFSMKNGEAPGRRIGYFTADDINDAIDLLAAAVKEYKLPPKVLVVHRFTQGMIKNYENIKIIPEVQVVIDMDGFGDKVLKESTYKRYIFKEPVHFTGFKLFYKNDNKDNWTMYSPEELLLFTPKPIYIQYQ